VSYPAPSPVFAILGGYGHTGRQIARLLLQETNARLVLAGRHTDAGARLADEFNRDFPGCRVAAAFADAADETSVEQGCRGAAMVIAASSTARYATNVAEVALRLGIDYLDIHYSPAKVRRLMAMSERIERAGRCFITEAGFHPGLAAALSLCVAAGLDRVDEIGVAALINQKGGIPVTESLYEFIEELKGYQALRYRDGGWRKASWFSTRDMPRVNFGDGFGRRYSFPMMLEEMREIPKRFPAIREAGFYVAGTNWFTDWVVSAVAIAALWLAPTRAVKPVANLLAWGMRTFSGPPWGVLIKAWANGRQGGHEKQNDLLLFHEDGYAFTAIPIVACLLQYLDGTARKPGMWMMGHLVNPQRLLADMQRMGIRVTAAS